MDPKDNLEVKVAFMDDLLNSLNHTVFQQQRHIEALSKRIEILAKQVEDLRDANVKPSEQPPPHY